MDTNGSEYERWEERYRAPDYVFGTEPNDFLASCKPLLPASGRALAVADGEGRNGVWLAAQGLDVVAVEFSPSALRKAKALAKARGVTITFIEADVHSWQYPEAAFDAVVEIFTQFSSPSERAVKWAGMRKALKPGGLLIIQGYTPRQLQYGTGGPGKSLHAEAYVMVSYHFLTPTDENATRYHWLQIRNTDPDDAEITARITAGARAAFEEDRLVLEAVHRGMAAKITPNINLALDAGALRFRRELQTLIDREQGAKA